MFAKLIAPVVGVVAVLIVAIVAFGGLGDRNMTGPSPSPTPLTSAEPDASESPAETPEACGVSPGESGTLHVVWCVPRGTDDRLVVDFTIDAPSDWADQTYGGIQALILRTASGRAIAIGRSGPDTVDEWVAELTATEEFDGSEPEPITLDGVDGYVFDVRLAQGVTAASAPPVLDDSEQPFRLGEGDVARVWIVDFPAEALAIVTGAPEAEFEEWAGAVRDAIETLRWGP